MAKKTSEEATENTAITTAIDYDTQIATAVTAITTVAESLEVEMQAKVLELATLTSPTIKGMEGDSRAKIPSLYLRQPTSQSEGMPGDCQVGQFWSSTGETVGDTVDIIPILTHPSRKKWGEDRIDCSSLDGKVGTRYGNCEACPYGRFENDVAPACSPGHVFFAVTEDLSALYRIEFAKSSAKAGRNIHRLTLPPALWSRSFTVSTNHEKGGGRNYYTWATAPTGRRTPEDVMNICEALYDFFKPNYNKALDSQAAYAKRLLEDNAEVTDSAQVIDVETKGDVIDFSGSM